MAKKTTLAETKDPSDETTAGAGTLAGETPPSPAPSLGLDDEQLSEDVHDDDKGDEPVPPPQPVRARQGDDGRPFCPTHNCLQVASGSKGKHTHYRCPVPGCTTREKRARPQVKVPAEPLACPQRTCRDEKQEPLAYLAVDAKLSTIAQLHMTCPKCGFHVKVPRAIFAASHQASGRNEDLAAR